MAHMIDQTTGIPAIAFVGDTPWHKLGRRMTDAERRNVDAAMQLAGLNWQVETVPLHYAGLCVPGANTGLHKVTDAQGIIRTDTRAYLGTVGAQFTPIQNREALEVLDPLVSDHGCTIEVMASLDGGRRTFALVKMPDATVQPIPGDDVRGYICLTNAHDGSSAVRAILTPIRVVCQNTLSAAISGKHATAVAVKHTKSAPERLKLAAEIVERMHVAMTKTGETYATLAARQMTPKEIAAYIETVIPAPKDSNPADLPEVLKKRREEIARLVFDGHHVADGSQDAARYGYASAWRAYNAVTEYFDHGRPREAKSASARVSAYDSALFGGNAAIKAQALRVLVAA